MHERKVAVAAIKISSSGPRRILEEFLEHADYYATRENIKFDIYIGLKSDSFECYDNIEFKEVNRIFLTSYLFRFIWDNIVVRKLSRKNKYIHWFSIQDFSLNVTVPHSVYIHNPLFYAKSNFFWIRYDLKEALRALVMKIFIGWKISTNSFIIVQQNFVKNQLIDKYKKLPRILVAPPRGIYSEALSIGSPRKVVCNTFFYPAMPRIFKGHTFCFECALSAPNQIFYVTLNGTENRLSRMLFRRYGHLENIKWLGKLSKEEVAIHYASCDFVFFPSELETWGLPLTEARSFGKPLLVTSDAEYLEGPLGGYESVFSIRREVDDFMEFIENPLKYKINISENDNVIDWSAICRLIDNDI